MPVPGAIPAPMPRRLLAFVIDAVAVVLLGGAFVAVGLVEMLGGAVEPVGSPLPLVGLVLLVVLGLVQWLMLARDGRTIGRRLTGIRLVRVSAGGAPGVGRSLVRLVVPVVAWLVPVLGPVLLHLSPLTDVRRRGWHDKAAGLMAVDVVTGIDPGTAAVASRRLDDVLRTPGPGAAAAPSPLPSPHPESVPQPAPLAALPWQVRREEQAAPALLVDASPRAVVVQEPALPLSEPVVAGVPDGLVRPASALLDLEDTAGGATPLARHVADPDPSPEPEPRRAPAPHRDVGSEVTDTAGRPVTRVVPSAAVPLHTSRPFESTPEEEDVESTRLRPARGKVPELAEGRGPEVVVELTDGQRVTVTGSALVGRDPAPRAGEERDRLIRVADPGRSVSKTHLRLGVDRGGLWIMDRDSTNGTLVTLADGQQILCGAEQQVRLPAGATVAFGDYGLSVVPPT